MPDNAVILLVEDSEDDILLMRRAFKTGGLLNPFQIVRSGEEALTYLAGEAKYANRAEYPLPALVLLDLTLPGINGFQVLTWIRQHDGIRSIPVIVLTGSAALHDVNRAYALGANSFFLKDLDFQEATALSRLLREYWIERALSPESHRPPRTKPKS